MKRRARLNAVAAQVDDLLFLTCKESGKWEFAMELARITSKGQMTIPKRVREAARLAPGDVVSFVVESDRVTLRKLPSSDDAYLLGVQEALEEWNSPEDNDAWRDL